ncbi:MAG: helix-turn-helix transcriptional regulator [Eggerthellaceae bacterium]|nr:helix-turn-helix transcriptional regulator [Eggerthellaceae bacterium]
MSGRVVEGITRAFSSAPGFSRRRLVGNIALAVSIGALSAWLLMMFASVTAYVQSADGPEPALNRAYLANAVAFALCCLALYLRNSALTAFIESKALALPLAVLLAIGSLILSYSGISTDIMWVLVAVGAVLCATSSVGLFAMIGHRFGCLTYRERLLYTVVGFLLTSLLITAFAFFTKLPALIFAVATALLVGLALLLSDRLTGTRAPAEEPPEAGDMELIARRRLLYRFAILIFLWRMLVEWARTMLIHGGVNAAGTTMFARINALGTLSVIIVTFAIIVAIAVIPRFFRLSYAYRVVLITSLCAILLIQVSPSPDGMPVVPYALCAGTTVLLQMITWACAVALVGAVKGKSASQVILLLVGASYTGAGVGFGMAFLVNALLPHTAMVLTVAVVIAVCILVMSYLTVFTEQDLDFISRLMPNSQHRRFMDACAQLAERYGLSEREAEVLVLLAKGRNASYISENLWISQNTATTHRKRIYQKMDVHSQQELMNLVEREVNPTLKGN